MPYLHLPVQSGSDTVLKAMNRGHTADDYLRLVERIRAHGPTSPCRGDFIVGFPGETRRRLRGDPGAGARGRLRQAFSFKYSPPPGTPAAALPDQVDAAVKDERLQQLQRLLAEQQAAFSGLVGREIALLIDKPGRQAGQLVGRSPWLQPVIVDETVGQIGDIIRVEITRCGTASLYAEPVAD